MNTRAIVATAVGNMLEWYDFVIFAQFAGYIGTNFFPGDDANARLLKAFLAFGVGFLVRPLGALLIGGYADRAGRRAALTLTLLLMAAGTAVIAVAPGYATIGLGAPLLLLVGRLLQGLSAGGEVGGATTYLFETAAPPRQGMIASWVQASMGMANVLGALLAFTVSACLSTRQLAAWGWRVPFVFGLGVAPAAVFLRRTLRETPAFERELGRRRAVRRLPAPWLDIFRHHGHSLAVGLSVATLWATSVYVLIVFLPTYVQRPDTYGFSAAQAFGASLCGNVPLVIGCVVCGDLSDRIGRRIMLGTSAALLLVCVLPLFMWLHAAPTTTTLILVQSALCLLVAGFVGVAPAAVAEIFPTGVRTTGTALVYNGAFALFGGFAPAILTALTQRPAGTLYAPAWYVMLAAVATLIALPFLKKHELDQGLSSDRSSSMTSA